ncbi:MAG: hypothetical protein U1D35_18225, partial [Paracoccaceae bacterium]|nr:hypothetical protein [Paracoccaceae bacterium]
MRTSLLAVLSVTLILSGCGAGTGLNPFKSSAQPRPEAVQTTVAAAPQRTGQGLSKDPGLVQGSTLTPYSLLGKPQTTAPQGEAAPQARQGSRLNPLNWFGRRRTA